MNSMNALSLARAQGVFNVASGAWPLLHLPSFECVFGPKRKKREQDWLVRTVAGLLVSNGVNQLRTPSTPQCLAQARRTGVGTAVTLLLGDVIHVPTGHARRAHIADAAIEAGWLIAWWKHSRHRP
ncbi:hypothetical protein [Streptomyces sp. ME19-01-6]|uniref:hypothetical protein n=1 Tax=Streptomyces sp. ME19-01-6 TaxID=3028686 RepID=UPI0029B27991|nr:hypothetical protein [Streptomyces sp. ME19-01-6]MDX3225170.1 hypothetical protein [Streptomyces sp. ME19-01-6]